LTDEPRAPNVGIGMFDEVTEPERHQARPLCLEIMLPDIPPYTVSLTGDTEVILGRARTVGVHLDHRSVSREHARLHLRERIEIEDLGSRNGTRVRGVNLVAGQAEALGVGDSFEVGSVVLRILPERRSEPALERRQPGSGRAALDAPEGWYAPTSSAMQAVLSSIERVAASDMSVLLIGETGVGKEVCAELVHRRSPRARSKFLRLNCTALPETLIESELFGHEKGAFTGATAARAGLIESADGGTVFLDEIAELPHAVQVKLLRVLDRREVLRIGGRGEKLVDVRFVAATHKSLEAEIAAGRFRQDLYYRLAGMSIRIPPLRERRDEIASLALQFLASAARRQNRLGVSLSPAAISAMEEYPWPGNIRELRNAIERALVVCGGHVVDAVHLALDFESGPRGRPTIPIPIKASLNAEVEDLERSRVESALAASGGNQSEAARRLGISRGALLARLRAWGKAGR
jgi:two-component system, NtrC family, response regulator AtoC